MASSYDPHKHLEKKAEKHMRCGMHVRFLEECLSSGIVPKGLQLNLRVNIGKDSNELQSSIDRLLNKVSLEICEKNKDEQHKKTRQLQIEVE
ncbi:hypothetical protein ACF0H5_012889 [Mactra antiquata]